MGESQGDRPIQIQPGQTTGINFNAFIPGAQFPVRSEVVTPGILPPASRVFLGEHLALGPVPQPLEEGRGDKPSMPTAFEKLNAQYSDNLRKPDASEKLPYGQSGNINYITDPSKVVQADVVLEAGKAPQINTDLSQGALKQLNVYVGEGVTEEQRKALEGAIEAQSGMKPVVTNNAEIVTPPRPQPPDINPEPAPPTPNDGNCGPGPRPSPGPGPDGRDQNNLNPNDGNLNDRNINPDVSRLINGFSPEFAKAINSATDMIRAKGNMDFVGYGHYLASRFDKFALFAGMTPEEIQEYLKKHPELAAAMEKDLADETKELTAKGDTKEAARLNQFVESFKNPTLEFAGKLKEFSTAYKEGKLTETQVKELFPSGVQHALIKHGVEAGMKELIKEPEYRGIDLAKTPEVADKDRVKRLVDQVTSNLQTNRDFVKKAFESKTWDTKVPAAERREKIVLP